MWRIDKAIAAPVKLIVQELLDDLTDQSPVRVPQRESRADGVPEAEQIKFSAQPAVIALLGLFLLLDPFVKLFLREEGRSINALHLLARFVAFPVRASDRKQLDRFDLARRRDVRPEA